MHGTSLQLRAHADNIQTDCSIAKIDGVVTNWWEEPTPSSPPIPSPDPAPRAAALAQPYGRPDNGAPPFEPPPVARRDRPSSRSGLGSDGRGEEASSLSAQETVTLTYHDENGSHHATIDRDRLRDALGTTTGSCVGHAPAAKDKDQNEGRGEPPHPRPQEPTPTPPDRDIPGGPGARLRFQGACLAVRRRGTQAGTHVYRQSRPPGSPLRQRSARLLVQTAEPEDSVISATLIKPRSDGFYRTIAACSRSMTSQEAGRSRYEQEIITILFALMKWESMLRDDRVRFDPDYEKKARERRGPKASSTMYDPCREDGGVQSKSDRYCQVECHVQPLIWLYNITNYLPIVSERPGSSQVIVDGRIVGEASTSLLFLHFLWTSLHEFDFNAVQRLEFTLCEPAFEHSFCREEIEELKNTSRYLQAIDAPRPLAPKQLMEWRTPSPHPVSLAPMCPSEDPARLENLPLFSRQTHTVPAYGAVQVSCLAPAGLLGRGPVFVGPATGPNPAVPSMTPTSESSEAANHWRRESATDPRKIQDLHQLDCLLDRASELQGGIEAQGIDYEAAVRPLRHLVHLVSTGTPQDRNRHFGMNRVSDIVARPGTQQQLCQLTKAIQNVRVVVPRVGSMVQTSIAIVNLKPNGHLWCMVWNLTDRAVVVLKGTNVCNVSYDFSLLTPQPDQLPRTTRSGIVVDPSPVPLHPVPVPRTAACGVEAWKVPNHPTAPENRRNSRRSDERTKKTQTKPHPAELKKLLMARLSTEERNHPDPVQALVERQRIHRGPPPYKRPPQRPAPSPPPSPPASPTLSRRPVVPQAYIDRKSTQPALIRAAQRVTRLPRLFYRRIVDRLSFAQPNRMTCVDSNASLAGSLMHGTSLNLRAHADNMQTDCSIGDKHETGIETPPPSPLPSPPASPGHSLPPSPLPSPPASPGHSPPPSPVATRRSTDRDSASLTPGDRPPSPPEPLDSPSEEPSEMTLKTRGDEVTDFVNTIESSGETIPTTPKGTAQGTSSDHSGYESYKPKGASEEPNSAMKPSPSPRTLTPEEHQEAIENAVAEALADYDKRRDESTREEVSLALAAHESRHREAEEMEAERTRRAIAAAVLLTNETRDAEDAKKQILNEKKRHDLIKRNIESQQESQAQNAKQAADSDANRLNLVQQLAQAEEQMSNSSKSSEEAEKRAEALLEQQSSVIDLLNGELADANKIKETAAQDRQREIRQHRIDAAATATAATTAALEKSDRRAKHAEVDRDTAEREKETAEREMKRLREALESKDAARLQENAEFQTKMLAERDHFQKKLEAEHQRNKAHLDRQRRTDQEATVKMRTLAQLRADELRSPCGEPGSSSNPDRHQIEADRELASRLSEEILVEEVKRIENEGDSATAARALVNAGEAEAGKFPNLPPPLTAPQSNTLPPVPPANSKGGKGVGAVVRKGKEAVGRGQPVNQWGWERQNPNQNEDLRTPITATQGPPKDPELFESPELMPQRPQNAPSPGASERRKATASPPTDQNPDLEALIREFTEARRQDKEERRKILEDAKVSDEARRQNAADHAADYASLEERMANAAREQEARLEEALKQVHNLGQASPKELPSGTAMVTTSEASISQVGSLADFSNGSHKSGKKKPGKKTEADPGDPDDDDDDDDEDDDDDDNLSQGRSTHYSRVPEDRRHPRPSDAKPDKHGKYHGSAPFLRFGNNTDIPDMLYVTEADSSTFPEAPEKGFREDYLFQDSVFKHEVEAMLKADKDDALGAHPYHRSFVTKENLALRLKAINQKGRGSTANSRDIKLVQYLSKLSDPKSTKTVRAETWIDMRGPFLMSVRRCTIRGCPQQELLEVVHSMVVDKQIGNANICNTIELALKDSVMQGVPLMQWEVIFKRLDGLFLRGTTLDGTEAVVTWNNMTSRQASQDLKILTADIRQRQLDFKEVKYLPRNLKQKLEELCLNNTTNLNEAFAKLRQMLVNDEVNKGLGIHLASIVDAAVFEINGLIDEEPDSPKAIKMQKENVHWIYVHRLLAAEQVYLSKDAAGGKSQEADDAVSRHKPRTRVNAALRTAPPPVPQSTPVTYVSGSESDGSSHAPLPAPRVTLPRPTPVDVPRPVASARHPKGDYGVITASKGDMQGRDIPSDKALRKIYVAALRHQDDPTIKKVFQIIERGPPKTRGRPVAAVTTHPVLPRSNTAGASASLPPTLSWKPVPGRWGRKCAPPANGLGNPSGGDWTIPQWQDCCVNYDNLPEYQKPDYEHTGILARLATARPDNKSRNTVKLNRPATFARDDSIPIDNCSYCFLTPVATGSEADEKHPQNWRFGTGNGAHPERTCQCHKRAVIELGNGRDQRNQAHLVHTHANLVMVRMPGSENRGPSTPYPTKHASS